MNSEHTHHPTKRVEYQHREAFCLMTYRCNDCGVVEVLWNSRDGVTPFMISCDECDGGTMQHVAWSNNSRAPDYTLIMGQRFFRDGVTADAVDILRRRFENTNYSITAEKRDLILAKCERGESSEFPPGWPFVDRCREGPRNLCEQLDHIMRGL